MRVVAVIHDSLLASLYAKSGATRWELSPSRFTEALTRSCAQRFGTDAVATDEIVRAYLESLHLEDLALACACRDGYGPAWDHFLADVLPRVRASARAMAGEPGAHLADDLLADLYGIVERDGTRRPLFDYFHGRSRLTTWLRTVVAQRYVDRLRAARRTVSMDEPPTADDVRSGEERLSAIGGPASGTERDMVLAVDRPAVLALFEGALGQAVARLLPADRLRLSYYYVQHLKLAQIGRLMGEHESSVSRKLERTRQQVRQEVIQGLAARGLSDADLRQCLDEAGRVGGLELVSLLEGKSGEG